MFKEPKDGDLRLYHRHTEVFKTFSNNKELDTYTLQRYHSSNGWADLESEHNYQYFG